MSIKGKALQLKQDFDDVHEAGKQSVIANSKYIPKTATGKVINLTDVSEVAHKVKVYGDGQEVEVYGKNLFDVYLWQDESTAGGLTIKYIPQEDCIEINGTSTKQASYFMKDINVPLFVGEQYSFKSEVVSGTVSGVDGTNYALCYLGTKNKPTDSLTNWHSVSVRNSYTQTKGATQSHLANAWFYVSADVTFDKLKVRLQLEKGTTSDYEPYTKQTITATPVGTEIESICPNMTFITYSDAEANLLVEYFSSFGMAEKELAMWNALTERGAKISYVYAFSATDFSGYTIPTGLCKPKQAIGNMFYNYQGVELPKGVDCSEFDNTTTTVSYHATTMFAYSKKLKHIYDMGIPATKYTQTYRSCEQLETIEVIRSNEQSTFDVNSFSSCGKLRHCIFSGIIASDINLQWSPLLDEESLVSLAVSLAHLIETGENPEGTNVPGNLQFTLTVTLSEESKAILNTTLYPETGLSCMDFIKSVKGWNVA